MKKFAFLVSLLWFISNTSYARTGNAISQLQMSTHPLDQGFFYGYMNGVLESNIQKICIPNSVTDQQLALLIKKYMAEHPEELHLWAAEIILKSVNHAWPCQK